MKMTNLLSEIDIIAPSIGMEIEGSTKFKSRFGGFVSILIITASTIVGLMFGRDFFLRMSPNVSISDEFIESSAVFLHDLPLVFNFKTDTSLKVNLEDYFDPVIEIVNVNASNYNLIDRSMRMIECDFSKYLINQGLIEDYYKLDNRKSYCLNFDNSTYFLNSGSTANSTFIRVNFYKCGAKFPKKNCARDVNTTILILSVTYVSSYVDSKSFELPIKFYVDRLNIILASGVQKANYLYFTNDVFISDAGWLFTSNESTSYITLSDVTSDINVLPPEQSNKFYALILMSPRLRRSTMRNFTKIQDLFAKLGGLANIFVITAKLLFSNFLRYRYFVYLARNLSVTPTYSKFINVNKSRLFNMSSINNILNNNPPSAQLQVELANNNRNAINEPNIMKNNNIQLTSGPNINPQNLTIKDINKQAEICNTNINFSIDQTECSSLEAMKFSYYEYLKYDLLCKHKSEESKPSFLKVFNSVKKELNLELILRKI